MLWRFIANNPFLLGGLQTAQRFYKTVKAEPPPPAEGGEEFIVWASFFYELWVYLEHCASHRKVAASGVQGPENVAG